MGKNGKQKPYKIAVKQSIVILCMQIAIKRAEQAVKKPNCSLAELLAVIEKQYPQAFDLTGPTGTNPVSTLITSKLFKAWKSVPRLAKAGVKRTCLVCGEYKVTYRLILPVGAVFASETEMQEALPRVTQEKTGRKGVGAGTPDGKSLYWTFGDVDFRPLIKSLGNQQRQALWSFLYCLKNNNAKPTNDDVGNKIASKFRASPEAGRKRMADLEQDFCAVHAVKPLEGGPQYWVAGPAEGKAMQTEFVRKKNQENRLKYRLCALLRRSIPRFMHDVKTNAAILGVEVDAVRRLMTVLSGPRWRDNIGWELFPEEEEALRKIEEDLRNDGKL